MTTYDVLQAVRRRWYVAIVGLLLTVVACLFVLTKPGVYFSEADVYLIPPASGQARRLTNTSESIISVAGLVERKVRGFNEGEEPVSGDVTIVDMGVRHGSTAILPNSGGQWSYNFESPLLRVEAVSSSAAETAELRDDRIAQIRQALEEIQTADGIAPEAQITVRASGQRPGPVSDGLDPPVPRPSPASSVCWPRHWPACSPIAGSLVVRRYPTPYGQPHNVRAVDPLLRCRCDKVTVVVHFNH